MHKTKEQEGNTYGHQYRGQDYFLLQFETKEKWEFACNELNRLMTRKDNWRMGIKPTGVGYPVEPDIFAW